METPSAAPLPSSGSSQPKTGWKVDVAEMKLDPGGTELEPHLGGITVSRARFWLLSSVEPALTFCYAVSRCGWIYLIFNE